MLTHLAAAFQLVADPGSMPDPSDADGMEAAQEIPVAERRDWSPDQVVAAYDEWRTKAFDTFDLLQGEEMAELPIEMGDLGTHPMHLVADAYAFDHYTHLRFDLAGPHGPLDGADLPRDEAVLAPTIGWLLAGLPQMCVDALGPVADRPFGLRLEGPGAASGPPARATRTVVRWSWRSASPTTSPSSPPRAPTTSWVGRPSVSRGLTW